MMVIHSFIHSCTAMCNDHGPACHEFAALPEQWKALQQLFDELNSLTMYQNC
jgi:hypothetical protein